MGYPIKIRFYLLIMVPFIVNIKDQEVVLHTLIIIRFIIPALGFTIDLFALQSSRHFLYSHPIFFIKYIITALALLEIPA